MDQRLFCKSGSVSYVGDFSLFDSKYSFVKSYLLKSPLTAGGKAMFLVYMAIDCLNSFIYRSISDSYFNFYPLFLLKDSVEKFLLRYLFILETARSSSIIDS